MSIVLESINLFPDQIKQAWEEVSNLKIKASDFKEIKNILVAGMGGSALGARVVDSLNFEVLDFPLEVITGYHLPVYADSQTLVVISSYSGNTEETLSCFEEAIEKKCKIFILTGGGELAKLAREKKVPAYIFEDRYNPSKQPRLGLGYSLAAEISLLSRLGLVRFTEGMISEVINYLNKMRIEASSDAHSRDNLAKKIAHSLKDRIIVIVSSEHLIGASHAFKNMLNENSKTFAVRFSLPELNHHLLESLNFPKNNKQILKILFIESEIFDEEIQKRIKITKEVVEKNDVPYTTLETKGRTRLTQVFETIYLGSYISYYLALINQVDPATIPWVDYFKKALKAPAHEKKR